VAEMLNKRQILKTIYDIYDQLSKNWQLACKKSCLDCCTDHVLITGLEGVVILDYLKDHNLNGFLKNIQTILPDKRYHPKTTINQEAWLTVNDKPIPEPEEAPAHPCPFLTNRQCAVYPVRPMTCRTMVSSIPCNQTGQASMTSFQMSAATLFYQFIEMLDSDGYYGNYLNILEMLTTSDTQSIQIVLSKSSLLKNQRISHVMIPPEHQKELIPIMNAIQHSFRSINLA
jgi:Fe-S-cluster containining protein